MTSPSLRLPEGMRHILQARLAGRRPAEMVHVTDWPALDNFCRVNDLPCAFVDPLAGAWDWSALHDLGVICVGINGVPDMAALKSVRPAFLRIIGPYGWSHLTGVQLCNS